MLSIRDLKVAYGVRVVLRDISFDVHPGEILALIGPNGAGKSTFIRAVSGVIPIVSGSINAMGQDLSKLSSSQRAKILSVVPQARQLGGAFTVEQAVMLGRTPYMSWLGHEGETDKAAVRMALKQTDLEGFSERHIADLSGGEQQRVLLARALAQSTSILLLDEPTNHLDLQHQVDLLKLVKRLAAEKQFTVVMALHDLNLVSFFADRTALLVDGKMISIGKTKDVLTAEQISTAYHTKVDIVSHPVTEAPIILPDLSNE